MTAPYAGAATAEPSQRRGFVSAAAHDATIRPWRKIAWVTAAIIIASVAIQLLVVDMARPVSWDEAVYLSQVRPDVDALPFGPHRARGLPWVLAPVSLTSSGIATIRLYVVALTGVAVFVAFQPWIRAVAWATPIAVAGYSFSWFVLVSPSEVYPNALTAAAAVGAVGWFLRLVVDRRDTASTGGRRAAAGLAIAVALLTLIRPTEAVLLCVALVVALAGFERRIAARAVLAMVAGGVVGMAPWFAEAFIRFGGVLSRVRDVYGMTTDAEPPAPVWRQYLSLLDGPIQGPVDTPEIGAVAVLWVVVLALFCGVGAAAAIRGGQTRLAVTLTAVIAALGGTYLVLNPLTYLRFLLPAYAVACGLAGIGAAALTKFLWGRGVAGTAAIVAVAALGGGWFLYQLRVADAVSDGLTKSRLGIQALAETLAERVDGESCAFSSEFGWPQIAYATGCDGQRLIPENGGDVPFANAVGYEHVFALLRSTPPPGSVLHAWDAEPVTEPRAAGWTLYTRPGG